MSYTRAMKPVLSVKSPYVAAVDVLRMVAIFEVVLIHVSVPIHGRTDFLGGATWWFVNLLVAASRMSIPLFIMLSGFLILGKGENLRKSLYRIFYRLFLPYTFWFLLHVRWNEGRPEQAVFDTSTLSAFFIGASYQLYFLVILIGLYAVSPLLSTYLKKVLPRQQTEFYLFALLAGGALTVLAYFTHQCTSTIFTSWVPYTGFFVAGYVLGSRAPHLNKKFLISTFLLSWIMIVLLTFINMKLVLAGNSSWQPPGCLTPYFEHHLSLPVIAMSLTFFILFFPLKYTFITNSYYLGKLVRLVARLPFGIYLTHLIVIDLVNIILHLDINTYLVPLPFYVPLKLLVVLVISGLISILLLKIPLTRPLLGEKI